MAGQSLAAWAASLCSAISSKGHQCTTVALPAQRKRRPAGHGKSAPRTAVLFQRDLQRPRPIAASTRPLPVGIRPQVPQKCPPRKWFAALVSFLLQESLPPFDNKRLAIQFSLSKDISNGFLFPVI